MDGVLYICVDKLTNGGFDIAVRVREFACAYLVCNIIIIHILIGINLLATLYRY